MANDDLEPCDLGCRSDRVDPPHEDLERSLVRIECVVVTEGSLTRNAQQCAFVASDDTGDARMRFVGESVDLCGSQRTYPSV